MERKNFDCAVHGITPWTGVGICACDRVWWAGSDDPPRSCGCGAVRPACLTPICCACLNEVGGRAAREINKGRKQTFAMTAARTMYACSREDLLETFREATQAPVVEWRCACGCDTSFFYARDARALWVGSQILWPDGMVHVVGLEDSAEVATFVDHTAARMQGDPEAMLALRAALLGAWASTVGQLD